jgi:hypothetical protein
MLAHMSVLFAPKRFAAHRVSAAPVGASRGKRHDRCKNPGLSERATRIAGDGFTVLTGDDPQPGSAEAVAKEVEASLDPAELPVWVNLRHFQPCPECRLLGVERTKSAGKQTSASECRLLGD